MDSQAPPGRRGAASGMQVIFFGTAAFAVPSLEQLVTHGHAVEMCVTQPDRPQGRGLRREPSPVKRAALQLGLPLAQPERLHGGLFEGLHPDIGVVVAYGTLIRPELLALPAHGMLGAHPSLLPAYRGAAPVAWALLNGETTTGVTIFRLSERLDAGDILSRQAVTIGAEEDAEALTHRLAVCGAAGLVQGLETVAAGRARFEPQDESQATFAPRLTKAQGRIDWQAPAERIVRLVRATVPWPGATTTWGGKPLRICRASVGTEPSPGAAAGSVVRVGAEGILVAAGRGTVVINEIQLPGKRRMSVREFLAGHPVLIGEQFGS